MRQRSVAEMCVGGLPGVCCFGLKRAAANHAEVALDFCERLFENHFRCDHAHLPEAGRTESGFALADYFGFPAEENYAESLSFHTAVRCL